MPTPKRRVRVLIADDHRLLVAGLRAVLSTSANVDVVATAGDGASAVRQTRELKPDVVLMSVSMPGIDGVEATRILHRICPKTSIIALGPPGDTRHQRDMARAGAAGYLSKRCEPETVLEALAAIERGENYFHVAIGRPAERSLPESPPHLSRRELEVIRLVAEGHSNKLIARDLGIGVRTVETHRERVMRKLGVQGTAGLTKWAIAHGLVDPAA